MAAPSTSAAAASTAEQDALRASTFQRLHPKVYLERFLAEGVRPDGREFGEWRDVSVNVGRYVRRASPRCTAHHAPQDPYPQQTALR